MQTKLAHLGTCGGEGAVHGVGVADLLGVHGQTANPEGAHLSCAYMNTSQCTVQRARGQQDPSEHATGFPSKRCSAVAPHS